MPSKPKYTRSSSSKSLLTLKGILPKSEKQKGGQHSKKNSKSSSSGYHTDSSDEEQGSTSIPRPPIHRQTTLPSFNKSPRLQAQELRRRETDELLIHEHDDSKNDSDLESAKTVSSDDSDEEAEMPIISPSELKPPLPIAKSSNSSLDPQQQSFVTRSFNSPSQPLPHVRSVSPVITRVPASNYSAGIKAARFPKSSSTAGNQVYDGEATSPSISITPAQSQRSSSGSMNITGEQYSDRNGKKKESNDVVTSAESPQLTLSSPNFRPVYNMSHSNGPISQPYDSDIRNSLTSNIFAMGNIGMGGLAPGATREVPQILEDSEGRLRYSGNDYQDFLPHQRNNEFTNEIPMLDLNRDKDRGRRVIHNLEEQNEDKSSNSKPSYEHKDTESKSIRPELKKNSSSGSGTSRSKIGRNKTIREFFQRQSSEPPEDKFDESQRALEQEEQLQKEARDILFGHTKGKGSTVSTLQSTPTESSFTVPNPDYYYIRDEGEIYENRELNGGMVEGDDDSFMNDIEAPTRVKAGVLSSLLKLYQNPALERSSATLLNSGQTSPSRSGATTPKLLQPVSGLDLGKLKRKLGSHSRNSSSPNLGIGDLIVSSTNVAGGTNNNKTTSPNSHIPKFSSSRPKPTKRSSGGIKLSKLKRMEAEARITVHIADLLQRQRFILRICRALMMYGAPTHRLEEYMKLTSRVLEIDGQYLYIPGCMIVSFGDPSTRTSEMHLVKCDQGVNLSKLYDVHQIYKSVVHDRMGVEEASTKIDAILAQGPLYPAWLCIFISGIASSMVAPFAFGARWLDMPICFALGGCVGFLQLIVAPRSSLYSNVFEVSASIVVSFLGRAIGSIHHGNNKEIFCFGAVVQGSLALILPGYTILCGSLELQSRNIVAGAVRMFYAIIYSLFLGFGITLGAALYGWIDNNATSTTQCNNPLSPWFRFLFVPGFTICLALINQARISQIPIMVFISSAGYVVTYFSGLHFTNASEFTSSIGAFIIGVIGNVYSRIGHGLAFGAMLPAIFVQVPGGIASQGSLLAGIQHADQIVSNRTNATSVDSNNYGSGSVSFGVAMVEVSIGISVGLFAAAIAVYPLGKKRTGLFSF